MKHQASPQQFVCRVALAYKWQEGPFRILLDDHLYKEPALVRIGNNNQERLVVLPAEAFLEFAHLNVKDDPILDFARRYGSLGVRAPLSLFPQHQSTPRTKKSDDDRQAISGELKSQDWGTHIRRMREAADLWTAIKIENTDLLNQRVRWVGPHHIEYVDPDRQMGPQETLDDLPEELKKDDVLGRARIYLERIVTENLKPYVKFSLHRRQGSTNAGPFPYPSCLCGALWYQLAEAICEFKSFRACDVCGKPMMVTPTGYQSFRRSCSANCRMRLYDDRKLQARQLQQDGLSLPVIARRLDTSVAQIERWTQVSATPARLRA